MKRLALTTALVFAAAAPAFANDQLARNLGLEPGVYSTAELVAIKGAIEEGTVADIRFAQSVIDGSNGGVVSTSSVAAAGAEQLSRNLGIAPGTLSASDLVAVKGAFEDGTVSDLRTAEAIIDGSAGGVVSTSSVGVSPGKAQIAAVLGLDPNAYSLAELIDIKEDFDSADPS